MPAISFPWPSNSHSRLRSRLTRATAGALAIMAFAFGISAAGSTSASAKRTGPQSCAGQDILAGLQEKDPDNFERIMGQAKATENDGAVLWRIERDGKPASHLFGTIHLTDERVTKLSKAVRSAIAGSRVVALEVADISPVATMEAIGDASQLVLLEEGQRLDKMISAEAYAEVEDKLDEADVPSATAYMLKPWVVSMILAVDQCERDRAATGKPVLDMVISETAQKQKIPVIGLETMQSQLEAAAAVPMDEQIQILRASLVHANRANDLRETVLRLYLERKLGAVMPLQLFAAASPGQVSDDLKGFREELITKRNRNMRTRALPLLAEGGAFIAVGAMHLIGEDGLVKLFRDAGYKVVAVE